jgi:hypothetical protein
MSLRERVSKMAKKLRSTNGKIAELTEEEIEKMKDEVQEDD